MQVLCTNGGIFTAFYSAGSRGGWEKLIGRTGNEWPLTFRRPISWMDFRHGTFIRRQIFPKVERPLRSSTRNLFITLHFVSTTVWRYPNERPLAAIIFSEMSQRRFISMCRSEKEIEFQHTVSFLIYWTNGLKLENNGGLWPSNSVEQLIKRWTLVSQPEPLTVPATWTLSLFACGKIVVVVDVCGQFQFDSSAKLKVNFNWISLNWINLDVLWWKSFGTNSIRWSV